MAKSSKSRRKPGRSGNRKSLPLVALAGFLLVVWGFVLGVLVGRGTVPTIIQDDSVVTKESGTKPKIVKNEATATTVRTTVETTVTTRPRPTTTLSFYRDLSQDVAGTLAPLPPPTTDRTVKKNSADKPSSAGKPKTGTRGKKKVEPKKKQPRQKRPPEVEPSKAAYALQVAAFATRSEAEVAARKVARKTRYKVRIVASKVKGKLWHRVRVGGFATKAEARSAARFLKAEGLKTMLVKAGL